MTGKHAIHGNYHEDRRTVVGKSSNSIENIGGDYIENGSEQGQSLADAAAEIQKLLEQLEKTYPTDTTTGKMTIATKAIEQVENDPTLMRRILSALKMGGTAAMRQFINHPAASFAIAALEDWQNTNIQSNHKKSNYLEYTLKNKQALKKNATEIQLLPDIEKNHNFLFAVGALVVRAISLQKGAEILSIEKDTLLEILDLMDINFSYLAEEDVLRERNW